MIGNQSSGVVIGGAFSSRRIAGVAALIIALFWAFLAGAAPVAAQSSDVQTAWRLLDYMAVDYSGAVADGRIKSASEYAEMTEFAASVTTRMSALPPGPERATLIGAAKTLQQAVARKASPAEVARLAHGIAADLLVAYPVPLAPNKTPDVTRGAFCDELRRLSRRGGRWPRPERGEARNPAHCFHRSRPGPTAQPFRALSGHHSGPRWYSDAEFRQPA